MSRFPHVRLVHVVCTAVSSPIRRTKLFSSLKFNQPYIIVHLHIIIHQSIHYGPPQKNKRVRRRRSDVCEAPQMVFAKTNFTSLYLRSVQVTSIAYTYAFFFPYRFSTALHTRARTLTRPLSGFQSSFSEPPVHIPHTSRGVLTTNTVTRKTTRRNRDVNIRDVYKRKNRKQIRALSKYNTVL